jgi:hypothetical protein
MGGSIWELPTQPQKGVIIASDLEPALLNQWTHIPPEDPPLPHSTAKHFGGMQPQYLSSPGPTRTRPPGQKPKAPTGSPRVPRSLQRNAFFHGLRVSPRVPNRAPRRPICQCIRYIIFIQYNKIATARCRLACTHLMRPSLSSLPPSVHTAPVLRCSSVGLRSLARTRILLAAGAALRSSWCWPRSASYATPR